jgi:hypothetical protein
VQLADANASTSVDHDRLGTPLGLLRSPITQHRLWLTRTRWTNYS